MEPEKIIRRVHALALRLGYLHNRPSGGDHQTRRGARYRVQYSGGEITLSVEPGPNEYSFPAKDPNPDWDTIRDVLGSSVGARPSPMPPSPGAA